MNKFILLVSERPIAREEEQGEEVEISKPQPRTKNVKNLPGNFFKISNLRF